MKTQLGKIHDHFNRDVWWSKITITSEDNLRESEVFMCVSEEYLMEKYNTNNLTSEQINLWFRDISEEYIKIDDSIFEHKYYSVVYATTEEGRINGDEFLKNEIIPK
jgi:hypothetical protein